MIYFDNSATTCVDAEVADRAVEIMCRQFGNPSSLHGVGSSAYTELGIARNQIAKMIAARTGDIYFTSGGTESNSYFLPILEEQNIEPSTHLDKRDLHQQIYSHNNCIRSAAS